MHSQKYPARKTLSPVKGQVRTLDLRGGGATVVVPPEAIDVSSEMSEGKSPSAHTSIIDAREQEISNIYYINENNCFGHGGRNLSDARKNF
jgi:hypothetical protein